MNRVETVAMSIDAIYTAEATAWGGREGHSASSDGVLDLQLRIPKEMGGPGGPFTNPEQLFATGYASCFHSALKLVAGGAKVDVSDSAVTARVGIGPDGRGGFGLKVDLEAELPGVERSVAEGLVAKAHEVCPYSNATRGNIDVSLTVV
jgi:Ohr subfamily peroxiredoxin